MVVIRRMKDEDLEGIVCDYLECFHGMKDKNLVRKWILDNYRGYPRIQYFVAEENNEILGYILWMEKGGFRKEAVIELEQICVKRDYRGQGIGKKLIRESLKEVESYIENRGSKLKKILVTTGTENEARRLYEDTLGAKPECTIKNLFRGDELVLVASYE